MLRFIHLFLYPEESSYSDEVKGYLADLKQLNQTTCYPFLMHLFADFENQAPTETSQRWFFKAVKA